LYSDSSITHAGAIAEVYFVTGHLSEFAQKKFPQSARRRSGESSGLYETFIVSGSGWRNICSWADMKNYLPIWQLQPNCY
jgi:hypothetical protein